ncbi:MAG: MFS transporter, partial [Tepidisphaeraceae bacterium]
MSQTAAPARHILPKFLRPPAAAPQIVGAPEIRHAYSHFRPRILFWSTVGYGTFYFVRKNFSMAMPVMEKQLGLSKQSLGLILTVHGLVYGVSKFMGGIAADRANARVFMSVALLCSALVNVCFGFTSALVMFGSLWMLNGFFQGMGYPPCARLLTHWFSPRELATKMSFWNMSHSLGGGAIVILCGYLLDATGN